MKSYFGHCFCVLRVYYVFYVYIYIYIYTHTHKNLSILHKHTCMQTLITLAERTVLSITANRKRRSNTITVKCLHTHAASVQTADCRVQKSVALSHDQNGTNPTGISVASKTDSTLVLIPILFHEKFKNISFSQKYTLVCLFASVPSMFVFMLVCLSTFCVRFYASLFEYLPFFIFFPLFCYAYFNTFFFFFF